MKSLQTLFRCVLPVDWQPSFLGAEVERKVATNSDATDRFESMKRPMIKMPKSPFDAPLVRFRESSLQGWVQSKFAIQRPGISVDVEVLQQRLSDISLRFLKSKQNLVPESSHQNQNESAKSSLSQVVRHEEFNLYSEHQRAVVRLVSESLSRDLDRHQFYKILDDVLNKSDGLSEFVYVNASSMTREVWEYVQLGVTREHRHLKIVIKSNLEEIAVEGIERELNIALYEMNSHLMRFVHRDSNEIEEILEMDGGI